MIAKLTMSAKRLVFVFFASLVSFAFIVDPVGP